MSDTDPKGQEAPAGRPRPAPAREARLKAALKANMGRRKAQARERAESPTSDDQDRKDGP